MMTSKESPSLGSNSQNELDIHNLNQSSKTISSKRKRKSRKGLEKAFACAEPNCGKKFTRLEHLNRHQLNHTPKVIYKCEWPDCDRKFVREDLKIRHHNRHLKRLDFQTSSQNKQSNLESSPSANERNDASSRYSDASIADKYVSDTIHNSSNNNINYQKTSNVRGTNIGLDSPYVGFGNQKPPQMATDVLTPISIISQHGPAFNPTISTHVSIPNPNNIPVEINDISQQSLPEIKPAITLNQYDKQGNPKDSSKIVGQSNLVTYSMSLNTNPASNSITIGANTFEETTEDASKIKTSTGSSNTSSITTPISSEDLGLLNQLYAMGPTTFNDSEINSSSNELISWLFSDAMIDNVRDPVLSPTYPSVDSPMALQNLLTSPRLKPELGLSDRKRQKLINLIPEVADDPDASLIDLQRYIENFWTFFHVQYPILHKPTFNANKCPEGLLWIIIVIGAVFDRKDVLAYKVADPLRWILFGSPDFDPPAKLWVIQSLLLLELYEKTMSNRKLHIRGHIHHGSTLQLIRRGPMLNQSSSLPFPSSANSFNSTKNSYNDYYSQCCTSSNFYKSESASDQDSPQSGDFNPWKRWIQSEETKRAALLAFILDVNHAIMFGHFSLISVHEIRVSMPCSNIFWDRSPEDIGRSMGNMNSNTMPFIEALKMTLNNKPVQTSPFGRKAILSGLLSIQYNMLQSNLQVASLGWGAFKDTWRDIMRNAYMFWRKNFKSSVEESKIKKNKSTLKSLSNSENIPILQDSIAKTFDSTDTKNSSDVETEIEDKSMSYLEVTGCADPFLHLAFLDMSIAQHDLQFFCGAASILNNALKGSDIDAAESRIRNWVYSLGGLESLHFAVHFLKEMYLVPNSQDRTKTSSSKSSKVLSDIDVCPNPYIIPKIYLDHSESPERLGTVLESNDQDQYPKRCNNSDGSFAPKISRLPPIISKRSNTDQKSSNPYLAVNDPISHRPFIVFVCTMVIWAHGYVIGGPESKGLWRSPPPLTREDYDVDCNPIFRQSYSCANCHKPSGNFSDHNKASHEIGGSSNQTQASLQDDSLPPFTPQIMGAHVFKHMKLNPHKVDGLKYISWLSQETSRIMAHQSFSNSSGNNVRFETYPFPRIGPGSIINQTTGLLKLVIESLHNHRWELVAEGERLLTNCLERSFGKEEKKCHYLRWEC